MQVTRDPRSSGTYTRKRRDWLRHQLMVCHWCGRQVSDALPMGHEAKATVDHLVEVDQAPEVALDERLWVVACGPCNSSRGSRYWHGGRAGEVVGVNDPSREW